MMRWCELNQVNDEGDNGFGYNQWCCRDKWDRCKTGN